MTKKSNAFITGDALQSKHSEEKTALYNELKEKENALNTYKAEHGKLEVFFTRVLNAVTPMDALPILYVPTKKSKSQMPKICAVAQNSDWHTGEVQDNDEVEGFNEYNPEVQDKRIERLDRVTLDWVTYHRHSYIVEDLHVLATGDMISGDIHRELSVTNAYPVPVQVVEAAKKFAKSVAFKSQHFNKVIVHYITDDNHSRLTIKPQMKDGGKNSFNYLVGILAEQYLSKYSNVEFNIYPLHEKVVEVGGRRYLIAHGADIKGWMGVPWYSIERKLGREAKARMEIAMNEIGTEQTRMKEIGFHKYIFGHWHTNFDSDSYACSASLSGTSAYDHAAGRYSLPGQPVWMVSAKHGDFDRMNITMR